MEVGRGAVTCEVGEVNWAEGESVEGDVGVVEGDDDAGTCGSERDEGA